MLNPIIPFTLPGCVIDDVRILPLKYIIEAHTVTPSATCPQCQQRSRRIHSRYLRSPHDLPASEQAVHLRLHVRRFFCDVATCPQRTFAERLPELVPVRAQRTMRLTQRLQHIGLALGGAAGARLATQLQMPQSGDTLLRIVRAIPLPQQPTPHVLGVDDFAFRKGRRYGTMVVDLVAQRPVDLLPDRTAETLATWLRTHPGTTVIARDRAADYAKGAREGAPAAVQVADRFHLLCNLRDAVERAVTPLLPALRRQGTTIAEPGVDALRMLAEAPLPTPRYQRNPSLQRVQAARLALRAERFAVVHQHHRQGLSQRHIAANVGLSTATVRAWLRLETLPPERRGYRATGKIDAYIPYLLARLTEGCTNQTRLWREIHAHGFTGTASLVGKWIRAHRQPAAPSPPPDPVKHLSPKRLAWVLVGDATAWTADEQAVWQHIQHHAAVQVVYTLAQQFVAMVRQRQSDQLDVWLAACRSCGVPELGNFAQVLERDYAAVHAGLSLPWSSGQAEGQINRLKFIKRSGYGRASFDLLRQRVLLAG